MPPMRFGTPKPFSPVMKAEYGADRFYEVEIFMFRAVILS
jgi:hypothetical protein